MLGMLGWAAFQPVFYSSSPFLSLANNLPCSLSANPLGWLFVLWTLLSWSTSFPPRSSGNCWFHYLSSPSYLLNGSFIKGKSRVWFHALCHRPLPTPGSGCGFVLNELVKWNQIRFSPFFSPPQKCPLCSSSHVAWDPGCSVTRSPCLPQSCDSSSVGPRVMGQAILHSCIGLRNTLHEREQ